jgi:hypothetical protein
MALSPNYGWAEPDNSSLVKNGAQDIRALGDAIDTSVWNVGYGQAGKNKIINGDFKINQRAFTSNTTNGAFNFDRWNQVNAGGTVTCTPQTFTLGAAPVAGYEGSTFLRTDVTGQSAVSDRAFIRQQIESVRTLAGQTVTVSFWAKAASGTPSVAVEMLQNFGTGGSPSSEIQGIGAAKQAITTSWARYSVTISVPSISGKTLGTTNDGYLSVDFWLSAGSNWNSRTATLGIQTNIFDIWGVQVEYGSKATPFQTATGTIQGELDACMRYYQDRFAGAGKFYSTTAAQLYSIWPVQMRTSPTLGSTVSGNVDEIGVSSRAISAITGSGLSANSGYIQFTTALATNNAVAGCSNVSVQLSAEL